MSEPMKPAFPEVSPVIKLEVAATLKKDFDRFSNGFLTVGLATSVVTSGGYKIGDVTVDPVCNVTLTYGAQSWKVSALDLFNALLMPANLWSADHPISVSEELPK